MKTKLRQLATNEVGSGTVEYSLIVAAVLTVVISAYSYFLSRSSNEFKTAEVAFNDMLLVEETRTVVQRENQPTKTTSAAHSSRWLVFLAALAATVASMWIAWSGLGSRSAKKTDRSDSPMLTSELQSVLIEKRQHILKFIDSDFQNLARARLLVSHLMTRQVCSIAPDTLANDVKALMTRKQIRHLLIVESGSVLGVISDRDLGTRTGDTAIDLMTSDPITATPDTEATVAVSIMLTKHISCLPIVDADSRLCGVLTSADLMMALQCLVRLTEQLSTALHAQPPHDQMDHSDTTTPLQSELIPV
jgi:acetoin utilization protein AcuB